MILDEAEITAEKSRKRGREEIDNETGNSENHKRVRE
jgi:hypothetical protein